jgi:hypothetical protein
VILYRQQEYAFDPAASLCPVRAALERSRSLSPPLAHDALLGAFIDLSEIASAVADAAAGFADGPDAAADALRDAVSCCADALVTAWAAEPQCSARAIEQAQVGIRMAVERNLPARARRRVSQGFAYYALDPALYAQAAREWAAECRPSHVWCVGLRTIGLALSAIAAAALRHEGIDARVRTLRPRGHPFERYVRFDPRLAHDLTDLSSAWYLLIDEGPGISGSSLAGAAAAMMNLGIHSSRIVLMPAHHPDIEAFASGSVRAQWRRHDVRAADPGNASPRLATEWGADAIEDLSGGSWRHHRAVRRRPAVHPRHERRKYRLHRDRGDAMLKFVGYGSYGACHVRRAAESAEAGWSLPPRAAQGGWMETAWWWQPLDDGDRRPPVTQLAEYVAFVRQRWASDAVANPGALLEMMTVNLCEMGFDREVLHCERLLPRAAAPAVHVDAHMRPHEWLTAAGRYIKSDGVEHHDDHFFPGPTDIAWDLAGAIEEWDLDATAADALIDRYIGHTGDRDVWARLPFYRVAYLAFRGGYTAFSGAQLRGSEEAARFEAEHCRYRARLATVLQGEGCHSRVRG